MSDVVRRQAGFTLIETILVMAIGSALAVIALLGFSAMRGQAQFSDSVERTKERLLIQRQEALSTVKVTGTGDNACRVTMGKVLTFNPGSSDVQIETISGDNTNKPVGLGCPALTGLPVVDTTTTTMAWGVTYVNSSRGNGRIQVAFYRSPTDGSLRTATSPAGGWVGAYTLTNFQTAAAVTSVNVNVQDPSGRRAFFTINPTNNGVTRTFP